MSPITILLSSVTKMLIGNSSEVSPASTPESCPNCPAAFPQVAEKTSIGPDAKLSDKDEIEIKKRKITKYVFFMAVINLYKK